jgi:DNA invertase Pin-like site-specific DNA recombinase
LAHEKWLAMAAEAGIDLSGFNPSASLSERIAWALGQRLTIGTIVARFSSKMQHSTQAQVEDNVTFAARNQIYVPPEFICVDEGESGRKVLRDGLQRCKLILARRLATVLLVFKISRLFRIAYLGFAFFQEEIVEAGLRAVSISQGIDTAAGNTWKNLAYLHGMTDEMLLESIADHVRSGLRSLAQLGFVTGSLPVGFRPVEVPGMAPTKLGKPRTMPGIDRDAAKLIVQHYRWIRDGVPIVEGWRRWVENNGPCHPKSTLGSMSYPAYRRMLSNPRYTGLFAFGRTRKVWSAKLDYAIQVPQPDTEVVVFRSEELRIVEEELFLAVQQRLAALKKGPRGPSKRKNHQLWHLLTDLFYCAKCEVRFFCSGAHGGHMACKRGKLCPCRSNVKRKPAVQAMCAKLAELLLQDGDLIQNVVLRSQQLNSPDDPGLLAEKAELEEKKPALTNKVYDLLELAGEGTKADRKAIMARVRQAQSKKADLEMHLAQIRKALGEGTVVRSPQQVRVFLAGLAKLLEDTANGSADPDLVFHAESVFRRLVGDRIWVHVEPRPGRKRTNIRAVFHPRLLHGVQCLLGFPPAATAEAAEVEVLLRKPPRCDLLAARAAHMVDVQGLSLRDAAKVFQAEGHPKISDTVVWQLCQRHYEMIGLPAPKRPYNNGRRRHSN